MKVLVKNPFNSDCPTLGLTPSFWDDDTYYPQADFSFGKIMTLIGPLGLSPYLLLDPKISFLSSLAQKGDTYCRGLGPLGVLAVYFRSEGKISSPDREERYEIEYLPSKPKEAMPSFDQIVIFGETHVDLKLWDQLKVGGRYVLGAQGDLFLNVNAETYGRHWPLGMPTEYGWKFDVKDLGLENFELMILKK
jgi:hypothetical protein